MARTLKRLSGPGQLTNAAASKYTVPALTMALVRHLHVSNPSGAAVTFTMSIGADAAATRLYDGYSIAAGGILDVWCYYVLSAAEFIQAFGSTTGVLNFTLDGEEITLG